MASSSKSAMVHILLGLMPYSKQNLLLAHTPNRFFSHLEQQSGYNRLTLQKTMSRAKKQGFLWQENNLIKITDKGKQFVRRYEAQKLNKA